jgi:uncharacterized membrane protein
MENLDPAVFMQLVIGAVQAGKWAVVAAVALAGLVLAAKKFLAPKFPFFGTKLGTIVLALAGSLVGVILNSAAALTLPSGEALLAALGVWFVAVGGVPALTDALWPFLLRIPFVASLFPPKADGAALVSAAEKQGLAAAVAAKAPTSDEIANGR